MSIFLHATLCFNREYKQIWKDRGYILLQHLSVNSMKSSVYIVCSATNKAYAVVFQTRYHIRKYVSM